MTPDFNAVQAQLVDLARKALGIPVEEREFTASELVALAASPLEERLTDPREAMRYAAYQVGQAMIALVGFKSLHEMFDRIERDVGEREANWVCRSWVGLQSSDGGAWSD